MLKREYKQELLRKYALSQGDDLLLARLLDKVEARQRSGTPQSTRFLTQRDLLCCLPMLKELGERYVLWGGYEGAERLCLILPGDWQEDEDVKGGSACPVAVLRASYRGDVSLSHRDFLGALMGMGVERETVGDILPRAGSCDIAVLRELLPFLLSGFDQAGRTRLTLEEVDAAEPIEAQFRIIRDTLASLRLDALVGSGFSLAREKAAEAIRAGKVTLNSLECLKPDKAVQEGAKVSLRGMGKIELVSVGSVSRKNRTIVEIKRYI